MVGLVGLCGVWVMGEWSVSQWILGVMRFQKIFGLYSVERHIVEISGDVTDADGQPNNKETYGYSAFDL